MKRLLYLTLAIMLMASFTLVAVPRAAAATINVPADYSTIQAAIDAASSGDTIKVAAGTYYEANIEWNEIDLTIIGAGEGQSIIDGSEDEGSIIWADDLTDASLLQGFTIRNGGEEEGGGMYISTTNEMHIKDCTFANNGAMGGGGMFIEIESSPTITDCTFTGNGALVGGGVFCAGELGESPTFIDCTFSDNEADGVGGGMAVFEGHATLIDCTFKGNEASVGGGLIVDQEGDVSVTGCVFENNVATECAGGGILCRGGMNVRSCLFKGNEAEVGGGGIKIGCDGDAIITNSIFSGNTAGLGGGLCVWGDIYDVIVTNCTFVGNTAYGEVVNGDAAIEGEPAAATLNGFSYGGGLYDEFGTTVTNCIFWGNSGVDANDQIFPPSGGELPPEPEPTVSAPKGVPSGENGFSTSVTYSDVEGGYDGKGNINQDPQLNSSFHLGADSPCIDTGDNSAPALPSTDFDGQPRIMEGGVDMGADEYFHGTGYVPALPDETYTLEVVISPEGAGTVDPYPGGEGIYAEGQSVELTAQAGGDYSFSNWSGDLSGTLSPTSIIMDTDKVITANFTIPGQSSLPIDEQGNTTGDMSGNGPCQDCSGTLDIPEGTTALDAAGGPLSSVSVQPPSSVMDASSGAAILGVCDFGPDGATFDPPITVELSYDPAEVAREGLAPQDLTLAYYDEAAGQWTRLPGMTVVNFSSQTVRGAAGHFTDIAVIGPWSAL
ncbi:MAG: right-handed parallel beta-helix repeat-containing protein [Dehalococcoidia bacterium]